ncbi:MAG: histidine phosphatase family protein [Paludibacteraceae bacterium]|nr:histidine phosphatase family protein [Paludibacteraceae bacterium]
MSIKHLIVAFSLSAFCIGQTMAVSPQEEITNTIEKAGGNYYAYPQPSGKKTAAPDGYEAFYISHYGRHGSRYMVDEREAANACSTLQKANEQGLLTATGKEVIAKLEEVMKAMHGRDGDLTKLGLQQHKEIATRLYNNFPSVLNGNKKIDAKSTYVSRSILSMGSFCQTLKGLNNNLEIETDASKHDTYFLCHDRVKNTERPKDEGEWYQKFVNYGKHKRDPERLMSVLFTDPKFLKKDDARTLSEELFNVACSIQNTPSVKCELLSLFSKDELWDYWQAQNAFWYYFCGGYNKKERARELSIDLLNDIVDQADSAIANNNVSAHFRFGHDTGLFPLVVLMKINSTYDEVISFDHLHYTWVDFRTVPTSANIQFVFYKSKKSKDILVKILLNEEEANLPIKAFDGPYYKWEDLKKYCKSL